MEIDLVGESVKFMILGMAVVFVFLMLLVQIVKLQAYIINKYFPEKAPEAPQATPTVDNAQHVAAIIAAVAEFRKNKS
jgi:oxaloacetate decarboxylase gamma subunit